MNSAAVSLIKRMLHADPGQRPTIAQMLTDDFFTSGYTPVRLPTTCLTVPPRFSIAPSDATQRRPLAALGNKGGRPFRPFRGLCRPAGADGDGDSFAFFAGGSEDADVKEEHMPR